MFQRDSWAGFAAISQGPIGIFDNNATQKIIAGIVGERIVLPLLSAVTCLICALIGFFWMLSRNSSVRILNITWFIAELPRATWLTQAIPSRVP